MNTLGKAFAAFQEIWLADFEYGSVPGGRPDVRCLVAKEIHSGRVIRMWEDELHKLAAPPYSIGPESLFVAFFATAELTCHLELGWALPANVLDLYVEAKNLRNGQASSLPNSLLGTMTYFGLDGIDSAEKDSMRDLALLGGAYTDAEKAALLNY